MMRQPGRTGVENRRPYASAGLGAFALLLFVPVWAARMDEPSFKPHHEVEVVKDELLIKYRTAPMPIEVGRGERSSILAARELAFREKAVNLSREVPVTLVATYAAVGVQRLQVQEGGTAEAVMAKLESNPSIQLVEPNYRVYAFQTRPPAEPDDLAWPVLWGMKKVHAPEAWSRTTGSDEVVVAVMDSGIDYEHRDLAPNMWVNPLEQPNGRDDDGNGVVDDLHGISLCKGESGGDPRDDLGHGTHVAGTIAAVGHNHQDVAGLAWHARLMAIKFLCRDGSGTTADAVRGIEYALAKGASIINMSWGGPGRSRALEEAVKEADRQGVLVVAAAGNEGLDADQYPQYPAGYRVPNVLVVTATDADDRLVGFANWGRQSVHLAAPGVSILSTFPGNRLTFYNGTSMAAPHVSGCAALLKAQSPSRRAGDLRATLLDSGDAVQGLGDRVDGGRRLNCGRAASRMAAG